MHANHMRFLINRNVGIGEAVCSLGLCSNHHICLPEQFEQDKFTFLLTYSSPLNNRKPFAMCAMLNHSFISHRRTTHRLRITHT